MRSLDPRDLTRLLLLMLPSNHHGDHVVSKMRFFGVGQFLSPGWNPSSAKALSTLPALRSDYS